MVFTGGTIEDLRQSLSSITFVIFNYDRCVEHFLFLAIRTYFGLPSVEVAGILESVEFVHPYGQIGVLPWQNDPGSVPFGIEPERALLQASQNIRTFTESQNQEVSERARKLISQAETLVILGFGYLEQNVRLLTVSKSSNVKRVFMTTFQLSNTDSPFAEELVKDMLQQRHAHDGYDALNPKRIFTVFNTRGTCRQLMDDHRLRLGSP